MQCTKPISIEGLVVPCNKCRACRIARAKEWSVRMIHEMDYHDESSFVTLTYADDNLPEDECIHKEHFQLFIMRLRRRLENRKLKYYACGEYGEKYGRPHYHAIVFGLSLRDKEDVEDCWNAGLVHMGTVTYDSARYVADYIQKDDRGEVYCNENYLYRTPPFSLMSKGIGKRFAEDNQEQILQQMDITMHGHSVGIPKFYKKVLDLEGDEYFKEEAIKRNKELFKVLSERADKNGTSHFHERDISRTQRDTNIKARQGIKSKGRL
jgi:hypothetical protein